MSEQFTIAELDFLTRMVATEAEARKGENELWDQHEAAREYAAERGQPVQGVCPTMFRNPHGRVQHKVDCEVLAIKLQGFADIVRQRGYR